MLPSSGVVLAQGYSAVPSEPKQFTVSVAELYGLTGAQVRMARAFLRCSAAHLAKNAKVGITTVQRIEASDGGPTPNGP